ncbi:hypothetical protein A2634_00285 [Candidatus Amesbacteria bacterium RIFCSPHIGHO2_01_FULL_48_32]|uniref:SpoVT-AbrB domain-containing protein n=1 Tax=Candidatus Amesbacteria bacterium RIFCSPLOWO2_01_FULL_48_25 TaxID=1797259 RepID=A0A1F4ZBE4_9BACT|nr:MAG: hypothetical protein A2634_00285 [Candidatus Amesbacteria bacterium RIFCSPHIGHO2_01_FULL_48_32]OGD03246.1 MAG: hypothetical protein A2989_00235 [Candidatus Amesbacteria bacterium RIFCSPLOWO2_01_FULL_48_25]HJZ05191.1 hypothetical protein [Patescibacteria group bacterium]
MPTYIQKILKAGNSLCVSIPFKPARVMGLKKGQIVKSEIDVLNGKITYIFVQSRQLPLLSQKK